MFKVVFKRNFCPNPAFMAKDPPETSDGRQAATPTETYPNPAAEKMTSLCSIITRQQDFLLKVIRSQKRDLKQMYNFHADIFIGSQVSR